jgi:plastocyanin
MVRRRTLLRTVGALTGGTVLAGCTGGSGGAESTPAGTSEPASTTTPAPTPTATPEPTSTPEPTTTQSGPTEVAVGPEKRLRYEPETVEIGVGDTVRWTFESAGHNVTSKPGASEKCKNPEGAEPFASYEGSNHYAVLEVGETYEHEFTVPGEYVYVCAPHAGQGMVGTVTVTE